MFSPYSISQCTSVSDTPIALWRSADSPFTAKAFWQALEDCGHIGQGTDWDSRYVVIYKGEKPLAMLPVFIKHHHAGEYVFDHAWAHAFHRYGIDYYPRLVTCVPFTPVVGQRVWLAEGVALTAEMVAALTTALDDLAAELGAPTWHGLFIDLGQKDIWQQHIQMLERHGCQFLWHNQSHAGEKFTDFDDFLAKLTAKKRKNIRAERRKVAAQGVRCQFKFGAEVVLSNTQDVVVANAPISDGDWQIFYHCYAMTYAVRGQTPYLSLAFFQQLGRDMPEHLVLAQAVNEADDVIACALFFYDEHTLYGRYWGALEEINCLHFELCYYQGISLAVALGVDAFDPGTQGEHKLIRGFEPTITHSLHRCYVSEFAPAIDEFCRLEQVDVAAYANAAREALPFRNNSSNASV